MTSPTGGFQIAEGFVDVTARVDQSDVNRAARDAGRSYGDGFAASSTDSMRRNRDMFAREGGLAGTRYANGFTRDANGRLHDELGRFAREGETAGKSYGDGFRRGGRGGIGGMFRDIGQALGGLGGAGGGLLALLSPLTSLVTLAVLASPVIIALAGSIGLAAASAAAAIPAFIGLGSTIGTIIAAFSGVSKALKAYSQQQEQAGGSAGAAAAQQEAAAERIRAAQESLDDARRNQARTYRDTNETVMRAEKSVADAVEQTKEAQLDLNQARKDAIRIMDDISDRARDAALDEEGAQIRLIRTQERYNQVINDPTASDLDRREAALDLARAQAGLSDAIEDNAQAQEELNDSTAKGLEGSDGVVAAKRRQQDAVENLAEAQHDLALTQAHAAEAQEDASRQVARALRSLEKAQKDANKSMGAGAGAANAFADAMAKLTPEGREFVKTMIEFKKVFSGLRPTAERTFLPGMTSLLRSAITLFPIINTHIGNMGTLLGQAARNVGDLIRTPLFRGQLTHIFREIEASTSGFTRSIAPFVGAITSIAEAAAPLLTRLSNALADWLVRFSQFIETKRATGDLQRFFKAAGDEMAKWWHIFSNIIVGVVNIIKAATPVGRGIATWLEDITSKFREWSGSKAGQQQIKGFFDFLSRIDIKQLLGLAGAIGAIGLALKGMAAAQGIIGVVESLAALGPIGLVVGGVAIAVAALAGAFAYAYANSAPFRDLVHEIARAFSEFLKPAIEGVQTFLNDYVNPTIDYLSQELLPVFKDGIDNVKQALEDNRGTLETLHGWLKEFLLILMACMPFIAKVAALMAGSFFYAIVGAIGVVSTMVQGIQRAIDIFKQLWGAAQTSATNIRTGFSGVVSWFQGLPGRISSATRGMWDGIWSQFKGILNRIIRAWNNLDFHVGGGSFLGMDIPGFTLGTPNIPELQRGGVIKRGGAAIVADRNGRGGEVVSLPKGAQVTPLKDANVGGGMKIDHAEFNINGVWDFTDPQAMRRLIAQLYELLDRYEREHR